jgi:hypothetical protein
MKFAAKAYKTESSPDSERSSSNPVPVLAAEAVLDST